MSNAQRLVAVILPLLMIGAAGLPSVFAEIPSPYDEWDFDIISENFTVIQNSKDLEMMTIKVPVQYNGEFPTGTTNVYALVTDPSGDEHTLFGQTRDLNIGESQVMKFDYLMNYDGAYAVDVSLKSPSERHLNWQFDSDSESLEIPPNGLLKKFDTRGDESGLITSYFLGDPSEVGHDEVVHAKISLPDDHNFEKIALVNGEFVREYSTDVRDIFIDGQSNYDSMKLKLVQHGNILPMADAQETLQEYVVFYGME